MPGFINGFAQWHTALIDSPPHIADVLYIPPHRCHHARPESRSGIGRQPLKLFGSIVKKVYYERKIHHIEEIARPFQKQYLAISNQTGRLLI